MVQSPATGPAGPGTAQARRDAAPAPRLSRRDLKAFRKLLEAEHRRLSEELEALEEHIPEVEHQLGMDVGGSTDEDYADVAGDTFEREKGFAIEASLRALLKQVEDAMARVDAGTYGTCERCGRPIHPDRLRAIPYARLCIACKADEERAASGARL